VYNLFGGAE
jgi:hypothetical protein